MKCNIVKTDMSKSPIVFDLSLENIMSFYLFCKSNFYYYLSKMNVITSYNFFDLQSQYSFL